MVDKGKLLEDFGTLNDPEEKYQKRLVKMEWFGKSPCYEIRNFRDGEPMKRAGLNLEELKKLKELLNNMDI